MTGEFHFINGKLICIIRGFPDSCGCQETCLLLKMLKNFGIV